MGNSAKFVAAGILLSVLLKDCLSLKEVHIKVPSAVVQGHKATLKCIFDLEGDKLYAVKWYRGAGEFYRYTPSESNPIKQFKIKGFHVVENESNATQVVLERVSRTISGPFSCEVTADQPSFFTDMKTADLKVVDLPKKDPYIIGLKTRYKIGDFLKANCTSEKSNPASNLTWYVNGHHIDGPHVHNYRMEVAPDYITSYSTLRLKISEQLFVNRRLKIRCSASMHHLYHRSSEKSVELERKKHKVANAWLATTTSEIPPENWEFLDRNPPETTLIFSPINSLARASNILEAIILVPVYTIVVFYR